MPGAERIQDPERLTTVMPAGLSVKWGWATRCVPLDRLAQLAPEDVPPRVGDLAVGRILRRGRHVRLEARDWRRVELFQGDLVGGVFGNRYATDQFEGYVEPFTESFHILGIGGVFGTVRAQNERMPEAPTVLELVGYARQPDGRRVSMMDYGLDRKRHRPSPNSGCLTILVVGASMNSGKTTTAAFGVLGLSRAGSRVCAAKLTGTACAKDPALIWDAGAAKVLDFSDCGWPSTYLAETPDLLDIYFRVRSALLAEKPDFIILEVADGLWQRETMMLLSADAFRDTIHAAIFTGADSLSAESGVRKLRELGYRVVAVSGLVSTSILGMNEVSQATGLPCLNTAGLANGSLQPLLAQALLP